MILLSTPEAAVAPDGVNLQWEYKIVELDYHNTKQDDIRLLNAAGADGWEVTGFVDTTDEVDGQDTGVFAYMKRIKARLS